MCDFHVYAKTLNNEDNWKSERKLRLTSTKFKRALSARSDATLKKLAEEIYNPPNLKLYNFEYGKRHERAAVAKFVAEMSETYAKVTAFPCGLLIDSERPYIGATPDAIVRLIDKEGQTKLVTLEVYFALTLPRVCCMCPCCLGEMHS